jgi:hypothetical protein
MDRTGGALRKSPDNSCVDTLTDRSGGSESGDNKVRGFTDRSETDTETRSGRGDDASAFEEPIGNIPHAPIAVIQSALRTDAPANAPRLSKVKKRMSILSFSTSKESSLPPPRPEKVAYTEVSVDWQVRGDLTRSSGPYEVASIMCSVCVCCVCACLECI